MPARDSDSFRSIDACGPKWNGACLDWVRERDFSRRELRDMLLGTLMGSIVAAGGGAILNSLAEQN